MLPICFIMLTVSQTQSPDDPIGFVAALNAERSARGLAMVVHDPAAVEVAAQNNEYQAVYGIGHHYLGGFGQCAAMGAHTVASVLAAWLSHQAHADILLDPGLTAVGCHSSGWCWTVSTRSGGVIATTAPVATGWHISPGTYWIYPAQCYPGRRWGWRWWR